MFKFNFISENNDKEEIKNEQGLSHILNLLKNMTIDTECYSHRNKYWTEIGE